MKTVFTFLFTLIFCNVFSQDTLQLRQIDSIVSIINTSGLPVQRDSLVQDHPAMGIKTITYLSLIVNNGELLKYVNFAKTTMTQNGVTREITGSNSFYFDHNKLIKVDEYILEGDKKGEASWYFWDDKPVYYTLQSDKAEDRANLLITMSKTLLKEIIK